MSACSNLGLLGRRHSDFGRMEFGRPKQILSMKSKKKILICFKGGHSRVG